MESGNCYGNMTSGKSSLRNPLTASCTIALGEHKEATSGAADRSANKSQQAKTLGTGRNVCESVRLKEG